MVLGARFPLRETHMQPNLAWFIALASVAVISPAVVWMAMRPRKPKGASPLPADWTLGPRPVFSADERRIYRQLREALPHHIVLSKLPLVRFCQPNDPRQVRYWYDLLGGIHVTFAVCSANGRVLAAVDLAMDGASAAPSRITQIKQAVLGTGGAAKEQVQHMVTHLLKLSATPQADAADALGVALCHFHTRQSLIKMAGRATSSVRGRYR